MPTNPQYPPNIYLQGNLRLTEKRTVRNDARFHLNYVDGLNPGPTQRPNNSIPLKEWIQEQFDNNAFNVPCGCYPAPTSETTIPQACITTHFKRLCNNPNHSEQPCPPTRYFSSFYSCSANTLLTGCVKSYKIFNSKNPSAEILNYDTIDEINALYDTWETLPLELQELRQIYHIIEYITCGTESTESLPVYFELGIRNTSNNPSVKANVPEMVLVDENYTDIRDMGTVTAAMVNAEAGSAISINTNKIVYSNEYVEAWYLTMIEPFDIGTIDSCSFTSALGNLNITGINLTDDTLKIVQVVTSNITPAVINDCTLSINFDLGGSETNPQTLTMGAINLKAKVKKYPI